MSKYRVGDELLIINDPIKEEQKLKAMSKLTIEDEYAKISWGIKIIKVEYDKPNVTLTYKNVKGEENKVFAICNDIENFDKQKVLEKALLKAFQNEYDKPNVTLTYKNVKGEENKVFAICNDIENFDKQKVLEKALLKAFQNELIDLTVLKNSR